MNLFAAWRSYEKDVVPIDASAVQREECRRAFYAGATAMFGLMMRATEPTDEDACVRNMEQLDAELAAFKSDLRLP